MYSAKLGAFLQFKYPNCVGWAHQDVNGNIHLRDWDEQADGPAPTEAEVEAWNPSGSVTDVERGIALSAAGLAARRHIRDQALFNDKDGLVATCYYLLKNPCEDQEGNPQQMSASEALTAGQGIGDTNEAGGYGPEMRGWIDLGSSGFRSKIADDTSRPWFNWKSTLPDAPSITIRQLILDRIDAATNPS